MTRFLAAMSLLMLFMVPVSGQDEQPPQKSPESSDNSPRKLLEKHFNAHSPAVGSVLPDVRALDADGNEFSLSELKGNYSVLVFGCLT